MPTRSRNAGDSPLASSLQFSAAWAAAASTSAPAASAPDARSDRAGGARDAATIAVLYFAVLRDLTGIAEEELALETGETTVEALLRRLEQRHPPLAGRLESVRVAVNEEFVESSAGIRGGDVVALIPPVSGG